MLKIKNNATRIAQHKRVTAHLSPAHSDVFLYSSAPQQEVNNTNRVSEPIVNDFSCRIIPVFTTTTNKHHQHHRIQIIKPGTKVYYDEKKLKKKSNNSGMGRLLLLLRLLFVSGKKTSLSLLCSQPHSKQTEFLTSEH